MEQPYIAHVRMSEGKDAAFTVFAEGPARTCFELSEDRGAGKPMVYPLRMRKGSHTRDIKTGRNIMINTPGQVKDHAISGLAKSSRPNDQDHP